MCVVINCYYMCYYSAVKTKSDSRKNGDGARMKRTRVNSRKNTIGAVYTRVE